MDEEASVRDKYPAIQRQLDLGQFAQALSAIKRALEQDSESSTLWRTKGVVLGGMLQHAEALGCFERSTELHPTFFSAWYHRGVACTQLERYEEAILAYKEALRLRPQDASTWFDLGIVQAYLGDHSEAKKALLAAEKAGHARARDFLNDLGHAISDAENAPE